MKLWLVLSVLVTILALTGSLVVWSHRDDWLPDVVPTHWNAAGEPDAFTARDKMFPQLLIMPGVMVLMIGLAFAIPWLSPLKYKIEPFRPTYDYIMALISVMFGYLHTVILLSYVGVIADAGKWIICGSLLCLAALGNVLGKVQRNFYVGIRTPWTLASDAVWIRTHRLGAWMFVLGGLAGFLLVLVGVHPLIGFGVFLACVLITVFYSLWLYKRLEREGRLGEP